MKDLNGENGGTYDASEVKVNLLAYDGGYESVQLLLKQVVQVHLLVVELDQHLGNDCGVALVESPILFV